MITSHVLGHVICHVTGHVTCHVICMTVKSGDDHIWKIAQNTCQNPPFPTTQINIKHRELVVNYDLRVLWICKFNIKQFTG